MKKRIMWTGFAITALALVLFSIISTEIYYRGSLTQAQTSLKAFLAVFDGEKTKEELTAEYACSLAESLSSARVRVTFLDGEGNVLADSSDENAESRSNRPEVIEALEKGEGSDVRSSRTTGESLV